MNRLMILPRICHEAIARPPHVHLGRDTGCALIPKARDLLLDSENELFLSTASIWEMAIKTSIGKLIIKQPIEQIINEQIQINGLQILAIESAHALAVASLPWHHRDPFDRLLICQSKLERLTMLGKDRVMDDYGVDRIW